MVFLNFASFAYSVYFAFLKIWHILRTNQYISDPDVHDKNQTNVNKLFEFA